MPAPGLIGADKGLVGPANTALSAGLADPDIFGTSNDWAIGYDVRVTTSLGEEVAGEVFAFDKASNCVVLKQAGSKAGLNNLRLLKANYIKAITNAQPPRQPVDHRLPYIDPQLCREREDRALQAAEAEAAKIGVDVSATGQQTFDALSKTLPCRWDGKDIMVLSQVVVSDPYLPENCRAVHEQDQAVLERVRKMVYGWHELAMLLERMALEGRKVFPLILLRYCKFLLVEAGRSRVS